MDTVICFMFLVPMVTNVESLQMTFSSGWSGRPVCEGYDVEMTCIVRGLHPGAGQNLTVTIIRNRGLPSHTYCPVWPPPTRDGQPASCSAQRAGDHPGLTVNWSRINNDTLVFLVVVEQINPVDQGDYECGGGSGGIDVVADNPLTLTVQSRPECGRLRVDTFSRKLFIKQNRIGDVILACVYASSPPPRPASWFAAEMPVDHDRVASISSGAYTATFLGVHQRIGDHDVFRCAIRLTDTSNAVLMTLYEFGKPDIQFHPPVASDTAAPPSLNVWVVSNSDLLSPLTCQLESSPGTLVRHYGTRSATVTSVSGGEISAAIRCRAANDFGETSTSYNFSTILERVNMSVVTVDSVAQSSTDPTSDPPESMDNITVPANYSKTFYPLLPEFLRSSDGIILFSILVLLTLIFILTLICCSWKLRSSCRSRAVDGTSKRSSDYWTYLLAGSRNRGRHRFTKRALPPRPDSAYGYCEADPSSQDVEMNRGTTDCEGCGIRDGQIATTHDRLLPRDDLSTRRQPRDDLSTRRKPRTSNCRCCPCKGRMKKTRAPLNQRRNEEIRQTYFAGEKKNPPLSEYFKPLEEETAGEDTKLYAMSIGLLDSDGRNFHSLQDIYSTSISRNRRLSL